MGPFVRLVGYGKGAKVGEGGRRCEEGGEGGGRGEAKFEEGVGDVCKLGHEGKGRGKRGVFGGACKGLSRGSGKKRREGKKTDEVPAVVLDGSELRLVDDGPYKVRESGGSVRIEEKVKGDSVAGLVAKVVELPEGVEEKLEGVLAGHKGDHGVEGGEGAPACGKDEKVGGPIGDEARGGRGGGKVVG